MNQWVQRISTQVQQKQTKASETHANMTTSSHDGASTLQLRPSTGLTTEFLLSTETVTQNNNEFMFHTPTNRRTQ
jgi:hypothetical protein